MTANIPQKHDALTKSFLSDPAAARAFLERYLNKDVQGICDLSTLQIEPTSYVDEDLKMHCSDVTYRLELKDKSNYVYVYVLVEHQNKPVELMPFRVLKYQVAIIQNHLTKHKTDKHKKLLLPLVAPILFYNGTKSPYPHKIDIADMFEYRDLYDKIGLGRFNLVDLTVIKDEELITHGVIAPLEIIAKHITVRDFGLYLGNIVKAFVIAHEHHLSEALFKSSFTYLSTKREKEELVTLSDMIIKELPIYKELVMSYAESLKQEGKQEGMHDAEKNMARQLLKSGVDISVVSKAAIHLTKEELEQLKASLH